MSITIEEVQAQIDKLQQILETLKDPVLEISRSFTGHYFKPYQGKQYRRMESEGIPIWEYFVEAGNDWEIINIIDSNKLEDVFIKTFQPIVEEVVVEE